MIASSSGRYILAVNNIGANAGIPPYEAPLYLLLANVDCRDDSKEKDYINALKFYAVSGEEEKKEILTSLKKNKVMTNNENDFFYGYTEKLTEVMKWKESDVENN